MRKPALVFGLMATLVPGALPALEVDGVELAESVRDGEGGKTLVLNGAGTRTKFFFDIYVGALYLETRTHSAERILESDGANRVEMHFVYDEVSAEKLRSGWMDGFEANNPSEALAALDDRIRTFVDLFPSVREGDVVILDYRPGAGTRVSLNGRSLGAIAGADFNRALLRIWLGDEPPNAALKEGMLGRER